MRTGFELAVAFAPPVKQAPADAAARASQLAVTSAIRDAFDESHLHGWPMYVRHIDLEMMVRYERGTR
jgi:hypothetical protein